LPACGIESQSWNAAISIVDGRHSPPSHHAALQAYLLTPYCTHLNKQLGNLVVNLHLAENGRAVIGNSDIAIGGDEDLVEAAGTEGRLDNVRD